MAAKKYPDELRLQAVQLYLDSNPPPPIRRLAAQLRVHPEALRYWIRRARAELLERGQRPTSEIDELSKLRKENTELRRAVEVLKAANLCLAAQVDPTTLRS